MQESHNSIANVLELRLSRTNHQYIVAIFIIYTVPIWSTFYPVFITLQNGSNRNDNGDGGILR